VYIFFWLYIPDITAKEKRIDITTLAIKPKCK
jgi:hypothetical protein